MASLQAAATAAEALDQSRGHVPGRLEQVRDGLPGACHPGEDLVDVEEVGSLKRRKQVLSDRSRHSHHDHDVQW